MFVYGIDRKRPARKKTNIEYPKLLSWEDLLVAQKKHETVSKV